PTIYGAASRLRVSSIGRIAKLPCWRCVSLRRLRNMNDDQLLKVIALVGNLLDGPPFVLPPDPPIKHECYGNSFEFVMHNPGWTLVHGTPMGGANLNERIGHAWAEREHNGVMWVYDPTSLY